MIEYIKSPIEITEGALESLDPKIFIEQIPAVRGTVVVGILTMETSLNNLFVKKLFCSCEDLASP